MSAGAGFDTIPGSWKEGFARLEREHPDPPGAGWLAEMRRAGMERFSVLGFPGPRLEEWRKTNVAPIARVSFRPAFGPAEGGTGRLRGRLDALGLEGPALVFVNGRFDEALSAPGAESPNVEVMPLAAAAASRREIVGRTLGTAEATGSPFAALNTAFVRDGAFVRVRAGATVPEPLTIAFLSAGGEAPLACHPRVLVVCEENSRARLVEIHAGLDGARETPFFSNPMTEILLETGAVLDYDLVQPATGEMRVGVVSARIGRSASLRSRTVCLGGPLVRNDLAAVLEAPGADCTLDGLFLARAGDHVDNHTLIDHARPEGTSRELYKGVLATGGHAVFDGKIIVRPDARKTDAMQVNRNLLLADDAVVDTKPQLEILNNDVKCRHAATIGRLDDNAVFYLRSRAVGEQEARRILVSAFAEEILAGLAVRPLRTHLSAAVTALLDRPARVEASGGRA